MNATTMRPRLVIGLAALVGIGRVGQAQETDLGPFPEAIVNWAPDPANPLFQGAGGDAWDAHIRERGWIAFEDGQYRLWYTGYNEERAPTRLLGLATSPDGLEWARHPDNPIFDERWVEDMCVVRRDGVYHMFAEGLNDIAHRLVSEDGVHWTEVGPLDVRQTDGTPIEPGPYGTPTVIVRDGTWHLFYERRDQGVWLATSEDLKIWTNVHDDPVIALGPDDYDKTAVALNQVIERDGVFYGVYHANAHWPWRDWTTCVARSTDLIHWEKYPGNPIVRNNRSSGIFVDGPDGAFLYTMHPEVRRYRNPEPDAGSSEAERR